VVKRAFPVQVMADGKSLEVRTTGATVQEVLQLAGVVPGKDDKVVPAPATPIAAEGQIQVIRVTHEYTTVDEAIRFKTIRRSDPGMDVGTTRVARQGKDGTLRRQVRLTYEDGKLVSRTTVSTEVIVAAVDSIINVGSRPVPHTVRTSSGKLLQYTSMKTLLATAYIPTDGAGHGVASTGVKAKRGIVAVDPKVIPLGTRLYIPGYGEALAADTGGAIKGLRIDLCMESRREAIQFGRRTVKVYILASK
jgi:3D (Asp-Asp-Asp) domain-containing protein